MDNQQTLREPAAEIVEADVVEVVAGRVGGTVSALFDNRPDTSFGEINRWLLGRDVFTGLITVEIVLDTGGQVDITWFAAVTGRIFPTGDAQAIMLAVVSPRDHRRTERVWDASNRLEAGDGTH